MNAPILPTKASPTSEQTTVPRSITLMFDRQAPLAELYSRDPKQAWVTDAACTSSDHVPVQDPLHGHVTAGGNEIPIALHKAVGGDGDGPVPGDILCAALSTCFDSCIRVIANRLGIQLEKLAVTTTAEVDVRGTLCLDSAVPVGFQKMHVSVDLVAAPDTDANLLQALLQTSEACCVVMQTLRSTPDVTTQFNTQFGKTKNGV
ncbi:MAG: OsmC family protein [Pseudomonadales bacterium]